MINLCVNFLIKNDHSSVHVKNSDVIRSSAVILDKACDATTSLVPSEKNKETSNDIIAGNGSYMVLAMSEEPNSLHLNDRNN